MCRDFIYGHVMLVYFFSLSFAITFALIILGNFKLCVCLQHKGFTSALKCCLFPKVFSFL